MKLLSTLLFTLTSICMMTVPVKAQTSKEIHKQIHSELLTNVKSGIDKSILKNYIEQDLNDREGDAIYEGLSEESIAIIKDLLEEAQSHKGKRYKYGSKGPHTFDCSGFTGYVFNQFGYNIGSSSRGQYTLGESVSRDKLRPGDLVFFTSPRSGKGVGHVGIVMTADHEKNTFTFIHASVTKGIRVSESTEKYYVKRYIGAKRIINE